MTSLCRECGGTGEVVFTKERGGPICNSCGGAGFWTPEIVQRVFASMLDHPSVYMGGPSKGNLRRVEPLVKWLQDEGII